MKDIDLKTLKLDCLEYSNAANLSKYNEDYLLKKYRKQKHTKSEWEEILKRDLNKKLKTSDSVQKEAKESIKENSKTTDKNKN